MYCCIKIPTADHRLVAGGFPLVDPATHCTVSYGAHFPSWKAFWTFKHRAYSLMARRPISLFFTDTSTTSRYDIDMECEFAGLWCLIRDELSAVGCQELFGNPWTPHLSW